MEGSRSSRNIPFFQQCGFPQFLFMRLLGIYFFLSDILIFYAANKKTGVLKSLDEIGAVGHRIVHGGEKFASSVIIDDEVIKAIEEVKRGHKTCPCGVAF